MLEEVKSTSVNEYVKQAIVQFNVTDHAINELKQKYMPLKIENLDDKAGYDAVYNALREVKGLRINVDKKRKELNEDAVYFQKKVNEEAKRITGELLEVENHLSEERSAYEAEKERIKKEKEAAKQKKIQARIASLLSIGFVFNGNEYISDCGMAGTVWPAENLQSIEDEEFEAVFQIHKKDYEDEQARLNALRQQQKDEEEKARAAQLEAQAKRDAEIKAEKDRLAKIEEEQKAKQAALDEAARIQKQKEDEFAAKEAKFAADQKAAADAEEHKARQEKWRQEALAEKNNITQTADAPCEEDSDTIPNNAPDNYLDKIRILSLFKSIEDTLRGRQEYSKEIEDIAYRATIGFYEIINRVKHEVSKL